MSDELPVPADVEFRRELAALRVEVEQHRRDAEDAAGELLIPIPAAGTVEAKLLKANSLMRRERDDHFHARRDLEAEVERLKAAIREHRDQRGDNRCWLDDLNLYTALGEGTSDPWITELPTCSEFLQSCRRYWQQRQAPECRMAEDALGEMTIAQLEAECKRLTLLNEDKHRHIQAYCKAADEDRAVIGRLTMEIDRIASERDAICRYYVHEWAFDFWGALILSPGFADPKPIWEEFDSEAEAVAAIRKAAGLDRTDTTTERSDP